MKVALMKAPGHIEGAGSHYFVHPHEMRSEAEAQVFTVLGYKVVDVDVVGGTKLVKDALAAMEHQMTVAKLFEGGN